MITLEQYWMGRDKKYPKEFTDVIRKNGIETVKRIGALITLSGLARDKFSSGWRPDAVNDATTNAAKDSTHLTAEAGDVEDSDRAFAAWCILNPDKLASCGLWMEDPRWTPTWCHLQTRPPRSGKRVYIPSTAKPKAPALPGQKPLPVMLKV